MSEDRIHRIQKIVDAFQKELDGLTGDALLAILDPAKILQAMPWLSGMPGRQQPFDPYIVLGLEKSATEEEVRKRFRDLAKILHPDIAEAKGTGFLFRQALGAYETIRRDRGWQ